MHCQVKPLFKNVTEECVYLAVSSRPPTLTQALVDTGEQGGAELRVVGYAGVRLARENGLLTSLPSKPIRALTRVSVNKTQDSGVFVLKCYHFILF